ncbi:MAG TPA: BatA domain-containing protein, partial [Phycisphaerae bacterium]|nr:BatA domain-containing protein [Phycisphaerae bacterium]
MNWPSFLAPEWGWLGLLAAPLVALYLLRQRRADVRVSSTLLWSKTLADMQASSPFQKLRRNLLLLLQLLILAALVLTLMRPVVQAKASQSRAGVIVIDATASMQTRDGGPNGETRLERAKAEAKKLVDAMRPGDRFMLVADGGGLSQMRSGFSGVKSELKGLIDGIQPADTSSDLSESLLLAATSLRAIGGENGAGGGGAKTEALQAGKIYLLSDGSGVRVPDAMGTDNKLLEFIKIGSSDHSVGITALTITPVAHEAKTYQVFVGLKNAWPVEKKVGVMLALNDPNNFMAGQAQFVTLPAGGTKGTGQGAAVFEKVVSDAGRLYVRVDDTDDDFPLDNTAYGMLEPERVPKVALVTTGNEFLETFIKTVTRLGRVKGEILAPGAYTPNVDADLVILDGFVPAAGQLPRADTLLIRPQVTGTGDVAGFHVTSEIASPAVMRVRSEDALMAAVNLSELRLSRSLLVGRDPEAVEVVSAGESPLVEYKDFGGVRRYLVTFSPMLESNWYQLPSLLVFLQNVIEVTKERHYIGMPEILAAGTPAKLWDVGDASGGGEVRIKTPEGKTMALEAKNNGAEFAGTDRVGFYEVAAGGKKSAFAVNVMSAGESDIGPRSLETVSGGNVEEATSVATVNEEVWEWA